MNSFHLTISATTDDPDLIGVLLADGGLFDGVPQKLTEIEGILSSACHFQVIGSEPPQSPDTATQVQALIEYLGEDVALQALQYRTATTVPSRVEVPS